MTEGVSSSCCGGAGQTDPAYAQAAADLFTALAALCGGGNPQSGQGCDHGHHHDHGSHGGSDNTDHCSDHCSDGETYNGTVKVWGDPHVDVDISVSGDDVDAHFTTENGNGKVINLLDTNSIDITGKFDKLKRKDDNTYVSEETVDINGEEITVDAADDTVTVDGKKICLKDLEDGYCTVGGNKITKDGDKITIETSDGQKITITDKGDHLDTEIKFKDFHSDEMSGMIGNSIGGNTNDDANDYVANDTNSDCGCDQPMSANGLQNVLNFLTSMIPMIQDQNVKQLLSALVNFIQLAGNSQGSSMAA